MTHGKVNLRVESQRGVRQGGPLGPILLAVGSMDLFEGARQAGAADEDPDEEPRQERAPETSNAENPTEGPRQAGVPENSNGTHNSTSDFLGFLDDGHYLNKHSKPRSLLNSLEYLITAAPEYGMELNCPKSGFVCFNKPLPEPLQQAIQELGLTAHTDIVIAMGVPIGTDSELIAQTCQDIATKHTELFELIAHDEMKAADAYRLLLYCAHPRMNYLLRSVPPSLTDQACTRFERMVLDSFITKMDTPELASDQYTRSLNLLHLNLRQGGLGIKRPSQTRDAAYLGGVAAITAALKEDIPLHQDIKQALLRNREYETATQQAAERVLANAENARQRDYDLACRVLGDDSADYPTRLAALGKAHAQGVTATHHRQGIPQELPSKPLKVQTALSRIEFAGHAAKLWPQLSRAQRARVKAQSKASYWLTCGSTNNDCDMPDSTFEIAIRHRLNLPPMQDPPANCHCQLYQPDASAVPLLRTSPWHALHCKRMGWLVQARHDAKVQLLARHIRHLGGQANVEPRGSFRDARRVDILATLGSRVYWIDVVVGDPACPSNLNKSHTQVLRKLEQNKRNKYPEAQERGVTLIPFAMTPQGSFGAAAKAFIRTLARHAATLGPHWEENETFNNIRDALSVAGQRYNAFIVQRCFEKARSVEPLQAYRPEAQQPPQAPDHDAGSDSTTDTGDSSSANNDGQHDANDNDTDDNGTNDNDGANDANHTASDDDQDDAKDRDGSKSNENDNKSPGHSRNNHTTNSNVPVLRVVVTNASVHEGPADDGTAAEVDDDAQFDTNVNYGAQDMVRVVIFNDSADEDSADDDTTAEVNSDAQEATNANDDAQDNKSTRTVELLPPEESKPPTTECDMCATLAESNPRETQISCPNCNYGFCLTCILALASYDNRCPHCRDTQWYEDLKPQFQLPDEPPLLRETIAEVDNALTRDLLETIQEEEESDRQQRR